MDDLSAATSSQSAFQLWFVSLSGNGRAMCFPCDQGGAVELDRLSERGRSNYFYARAVIGHEFAWPVVRESSLESA